MNIESVLPELIAILKEFQVLLGHDDADQVNPTTCPHGGLKGFQSDIVPTIVHRLARRLGKTLPDDIDIVNIFASNDKTRRLTVEEAARRFVECYGPQDNQ